MNVSIALQQDVENELRWDPEVHAERIGVSILDGVVQLDGKVDSYYEKWAAEKAVLRLREVRALANDIQVDILVRDQQSDAGIGASILHQFQWNHVISEEIKVRVSDGWVTLDGAVEAEYQKRAAESAIRWMKGIKGIVNRIEVAPRVNVTLVKEPVVEAIRRHAALSAGNISIESEGGVLTLFGHVQSWLEKEEALRVAWRTPGVMHVVDRLVFC